MIEAILIAVFAVPIIILVVGGVIAAISLQESVRGGLYK